MTKEQAQDAIEAIETGKGDFEYAHGLEDSVRRDFLRALADGKVKKKDIQEIAAILLRSEEIDFPRYCA